MDKDEIRNEIDRLRLAIADLKNKNAIEIADHFKQLEELKTDGVKKFTEAKEEAFRKLTEHKGQLAKLKKDQLQKIAVVNAQIEGLKEALHKQ